MSKYNDDDFNASKYERKLERRHKRLMVALAVAALVTFMGMVIFWK